MFSQGYFVTAELRVIDASRAKEAKLALMSLCSETQNEPGCSLFQLHEFEEDDTRFLLWERFDDEDAFKLHFELQHTKQYLEQDFTEIVQFFVTDLADTRSA